MLLLTPTTRSDGEQRRQPRWFVHQQRRLLVNYAIIAT